MKTLSALLLLAGSLVAAAQTVLISNTIVHTVTDGIITNGAVLIESNKVTAIFKSAQLTAPAHATVVDGQGGHLYPGLILLNTPLGLQEIDAVRATLDSSEVGDYVPDVESWIAVTPDSELLPVARANGVAYFEPAPEGRIVAGQSGVLAMDGWTWEQMRAKAPAALHVYWPDFSLNVEPPGGGRRARGGGRPSSLEEQDKQRRKKVRDLQEFFDDARAYAQAKGAKTGAAEFKKVPAWEAMLPYVRGDLPVVIHADEIRQIKSAVAWAATNRLKAILAGGRDAWMAPELLTRNKIPVIYNNVFTLPPRDTDPYDVQFTAPAKLRAAGVTLALSMEAGEAGGAPNARNLPYDAAQAIAFGLAPEEAIRAMTLIPAQLTGLADRLGSIEVEKEATLVLWDGDIFDIRANVKRMWIAGQAVNLENRQTRLYDKYKNRPRAK